MLQRKPFHIWFVYLLILAMLLCITACTAGTEQAQYPELNVLLPFISGTDDLTTVNAALNSYLEEKLGVHVSLSAYNSYQDLLKVLDSGGQIDLSYCGSISDVQKLQNKGMLHPLDALLSEQGAGITEEIPSEYYEFSRIDGNLYAIPTNKEQYRVIVFEYNREIAQDYGLDFSQVQSVGDLTEVFRQLHSRTEEISPIAIVPGFIYYDQVDTLGDSLGVLTEQSGQTVVNLYETQQFAELIRLIHSWKHSGYTYPDTSENDLILYYLQSGKVLGCLTTGKLGFDVQERNLSGCDIGYVALGQAHHSADTLTRAWYTIPSTAKDPALSMQLMELFYTDPYIANLMLYGVEGTHYSLTADDVIARKPSSGYGGITAWAYCNSYNARVEEGMSPTFWEEEASLNQKASKALAWGFSFDPSTVSEQMYRCDEVRKKYLELLYSGNSDPDSLLEEFQTALKEAGIEDIIAQKQQQLDTFWENKA